MVGSVSLSFFLITALTQVLPTSGPKWDFNADLPGRVPAGWEVRGGSAKGVYEIRTEADGNRYLASRSEGSDIQLGTGLSARAQDFPILHWRWRAWQLPRGGDERKLNTLDSGAAVYAVFGSRLFPRILKYVWSSSVPAGTSLKHPSSGRMAIFVVISGTDLLGQWHSIRRNLLEDYRTAFGSTPGNLIAIGVKTDSDSTRSSGQADYDDIRLAPR